MVVLVGGGEGGRGRRPSKRRIAVVNKVCNTYKECTYHSKTMAKNDNPKSPWNIIRNGRKQK